MDFENVKVVGFEANNNERLFLEALHSTLDPNNRNDHGWVVRKPIITNPRLKADRGFNFSCMKVYLLLMFGGLWDLSTLKLEGKIHVQQNSLKVEKQIRKFTLILHKLNRALNNPAHITMPEAYKDIARA